MAEKIRVGIIGTSWYADLMHLPALQSHPQAETVAICGRNPDRAAEMAGKYHIPQVFTDYRAMLQQANLQAVVIATPDDQHYLMTMAALEAGRHVLCEKPLALTFDQAQQMFDRAEALGLKHMTYFTWRWTPQFQYLRRLINQGYLGDCYNAAFRYLGGYGRSPQYHWKWDRRRALGVLGDLGSHMIDLAHWLVGDITAVSAGLTSLVRRLDPAGQPFEQANDSAMLNLQFANGATGLIQVSALAHIADRQMEIQLRLHGTNGTLELDCTFGHGFTLRGAGHDEDHFTPLPIPDDLRRGTDLTRLPMAQWQQIFTEQPAGARHFIDAILTDQPLAPSFAEGLKVQAVLESALESNRREAWVAVEQ